MKSSAIYQAVFLQAIMMAVQDGPKSYEVLATELLNDKKRAGAIKDAVQDCLTDELEVLIGKGGGVARKGAERNKMNKGEELSLTESVLETIRNQFAKVGGSIPRAGVSVSFMAGRMTEDPHMVKKFESLVSEALDNGLIPGFQLVGRTVKVKKAA